MNSPAPPLVFDRCLLRLIGRAQQMAPQARMTQLHEIAAAFAAGQERYSQKECEIFGRIMVRLSEGVAGSERRAVAAKLAAVPAIPRGVLSEIGTNEDELVALLRAGKMDAFMASLAQAAGTDTESVRKALDERSGSGLVELCRTCGFSRVTYSAIVVLSDPLGMRPEREKERLLLLYPAARPTVTHAA